MGIDHGIRELRYKPDLNSDCASILLELFRQPLSIYMQAAIAQAFFLRKSARREKWEAVGILLKIIDENPDKYGHFTDLVLNELANNVDATRVHEVGRMALDKHFGPMRHGFIEALRQIGNGDAIAYLLRAAKDSRTASDALRNLARLRVEGALELCEEALKRSDLDANSREVIKETHSKLKRQLAKNPYASSHVINESVPDGLEEWSVNLDGCELRKALRNVRKCVSTGFTKQEILEVMAASDDLGIHEKVRFKFSVSFRSIEIILYLGIFCNDTDAYDLSVFGSQELVDKIDQMWSIGGKND